MTSPVEFSLLDHSINAEHGESASEEAGENGRTDHDRLEVRVAFDDSANSQSVYLFNC